MKLQFEYKGLLWSSELVEYGYPRAHFHLYVCTSKKVKKGWLSPKMIYKDGWQKVAGKWEAKNFGPYMTMSAMLNHSKRDFKNSSIRYINKLITRWREWDEWPKCFGNLRLDTNGHYFEGDCENVTQLKLTG